MKLENHKENFKYFLEGATYGSTWLEIKTLKAESHLDDQFSADYLESRCSVDKWYDRLMSGGHIVCIDWYSAEDNEDGRPDRYKLTKQDFESKLEKAKHIHEFARTYWEVFGEDGSPDYYDYNNLMQFVMFGELVYG